MRALISGLAAVLVGAVLFWQAPGLFPPPAHRFIAHSSEALRSALGIAPPPAVDMGPVWPTPPMAHAWPSSWLMILAALALAALAVGLLAWSRRRALAPAPAQPAWLASARAYSTKEPGWRNKRAQFDAIEKCLVPDIRRRGEGALARHHQLDLYWRFVSRTKGAKRGEAKGAELAEWVTATKSALAAVALAPASRPSAALEETRADLDALKPADAGAVEAFYDRLGSRLAAHEEAWNRAQAAVSAPEPDQGACLEAMEELRQINHAIAKDCASLVGDIEIRVRALDR